MKPFHCEIKCRRCNTIHMKMFNPLPDFDKHSMDTWRRLESYAKGIIAMPHMELCPTCEKPAVHDCVAFSPMPIARDFVEYRTSEE